MFILNAVRWLLVRLLVLVVVLLIAGRIYQVMAEKADLERFPAPGTLVDVDGSLMHIHCRGNGSPTVVIEQGLQSVAASWDHITEEIAQDTRVCAYDRAGLGYSEPVNHQTRATEVAERLHKLLQGADIDDDLVLAAGRRAAFIFVNTAGSILIASRRCCLLIQAMNSSNGACRRQAAADRTARWNSLNIWRRSASSG